MSESGSVLIVDNDVPALDLVVRLLRRAGYEVAQAAGGEEALRLARKVKPDLILLGVVLPDMSGLEVLRQIKADNEMEQISVVLLSSQAVSADHPSAGLDTGADGYIACPIPNQELLARVHLYLRQHALARDLRASEARFRDLIAQPADAVLVLDESGLILFANTAAQTLYGRSASTLVGSSFGFPVAGTTSREIHVNRPDASSVIAEIRMASTRWEGKPAWVTSLRDITERKQAEEVQARLLHTLETSLNEVYYFDAESLRFEYVNPGALRNLGYSLEAMRQMTPLDLKPEFTEASFRQFIAPLTRGEQAEQRFQTIHRRADGSNYPVEVFLQLVERQNKRVFLAIIRDNSERMKAERARDESEDRFRLLWQTCSHAIVLMDRNSIIRYANPALQQVFGHEPSAVTGNSLALLQPKHLAASHMKGMRRHLETGQRTVDWRAVETIGLHKDGHEFPVEITFSSMEINGELMFAGFMRDTTERKQAERALRNSEHQLRGLAESMPQMVWMTRPDGWAVYFNQRWVDYTGQTPEESQGHGWIAALHPDDQDAAWQTWQKATAEQAEYSIEYRLRRIDGSYRWMLTRGVPFRDPAGQIDTWMGTCTDIDDLKRVTQQLTHNSMLLRIAGKTAHVGGWTLSVADQRLTWSDEVFDIVEYPVSDEPPLEIALNLYPPQWREPLAQSLALCMQDGTPFDMEAQLVTAKGRVLWVRVVAQAERDATGAIVRIGGAFQDLSQIKRAEQSARESAERFRLLSKASRDAIWDWDLRADTLWWNEGYQELFGLQPDPARTGTQEREAAMHAQDRDRVMAGIREAVAGSTIVWSDNYRLLRGDGSQAQVDDRGYLIRDAAGQAIRMVGALTDVSAKLLLEEHLRQSQRLESIGQLTGGVAHDFNNLLTVILGNAELLQEELSQDPESQELASMIGSAAQRGAELTHRLLAFARKQPLDPEPIDVNQLIDRFDPLLRRTLGEQVEIAFVRGPELWQALADASQLESALLNLCINSRDAMPDGGKLTIETANIDLDEDYTRQHADLQPGDYVMLAVSDTGQGMEPQVIARVFEPFFTTKEKGKGSGLGLAMVYGFVKQSHGHVNVYSEPGHGTTMRVYLPRALQPADPGTKASVRDHLGGGGESILLVEDDELVRGYASGQLAALGYQVIEAPNGNRALEILRSGEAIDLLFTDVVMPGMGGRQLVEQAQLLRPRLKVLYTSGYTENSIVHHGKLDKGVHLLSKPYLRSVLANKLREVLDS